MFDNIKKFVLHVLAENIAQACTLLVGLAFKGSDGLSVFPLAPVEILVITSLLHGVQQSLMQMLRFSGSSLSPAASQTWVSG